MEQKISASKSGLQFALLFGVLMIFEFIVGYVLNIDPQTNQTYGISIQVLNFLVLPILFIYLGCSNFKNKLNAGFISFSQCLKIGVSICVIGALLYAIFQAAFISIYPEYFEEMFKKMRSVMLEKNPAITSEQIDMTISFSRKFMNPAIAIPATCVMYAFIGLVYSLIIGAIVKKDANQSF